MQKAIDFRFFMIYSKCSGLLRIKMKKILALFIFLFSICFFSYAEIKPSLSLSPATGFSFGQLDEILYDSDGEKCSLLEWEKMPLFILGISADLTINRLLISSSFEYGSRIALTNPRMKDSDWNNGIKYSWTIHPIEVCREVNTSLLFAYNIFSNHLFSLSPECELQYIYNCFKAGKGSGFRYDEALSVYGIDYSRHSLFLFTGIKIETEIRNRIMGIKFF